MALFSRIFWYVHAPVVLLVKAPPDECLHLLQESVKPSRDRLHLQDLFAHGRRYSLEKRQDGFTMLTTSKQYWRYTEGMLRLRRRTRASARLEATMERVGEQFTRMELNVHFRPFYLLDIIWIPAFFTSIIIPMPWAWWLTALISVTMFGLSYVYHYYNAAYQANEMIFFIEKVLKEKLVTSLPSLDATTPDVVTADFAQEWERFFDSHRSNR
jgi:hypothetical protein